MRDPQQFKVWVNDPANNALRLSEGNLQYGALSAWVRQKPGSHQWEWWTNNRSGVEDTEEEAKHEAASALLIPHHNPERPKPNALQRGLNWFEKKFGGDNE